MYIYIYTPYTIRCADPRELVPLFVDLKARPPHPEALRVEPILGGSACFALSIEPNLSLRKLATCRGCPGPLNLPLSRFLGCHSCGAVFGVRRMQRPDLTAQYVHPTATSATRRKNRQGPLAGVSFLRGDRSNEAISPVSSPSGVGVTFNVHDLCISQNDDSSSASPLEQHPPPFSHPMNPENRKKTTSDGPGHLSGLLLSEPGEPSEPSC